jgi:chemotaxis protein methyltransferase CheR
MRQDEAASGVEGGLFYLLQQDVAGFVALSGILKERAGIFLPNNSKNICLMASRLAPILRELGLESYHEYLRLLRDPGNALEGDFISAMTTNTTQFFRESRHFEFLKLHLPALLEAKRKRFSRELRVWCAAASTGQEPYTILMCLLEAIPAIQEWDLKFLASDIDLEVLERAAKGVYTDVEVASLPAHYRQKYLDAEKKDRNASRFRVKAELRRRIRFAPLNLLTAPFPFRHRFDIVFCRNVLIYFDRETAVGVIHRLAGAVSEEGMLFLGHSESGINRPEGMEQVAPAAYQRLRSARKAAG